MFDNKTILVTGGAGFFGQKFVEIILKEYNPKSVRIYDNRELAEFEMEKKFNDPRLRFLIGDVRDKDRLYRSMNGVDVVVHAAALKHVPIAEYNPFEAIKTNVNGTANVIDTAIDNNVEKAILISSDKAVNPVNLYGATKLCAEKLFIQANFYSGDRKTRFSCARYVNVLGSCGSIIPLFLEQKKTGTITVTHEKMTRFFITPEQGVKLVIESLAKMRGGEIFIPKTPSIKIMDLAKMVAPDAQIKIIGIRPGEKLQESLLTVEEARHTKELSDHFIVEPEFAFWDGESIRESKNLSDGFYYASDNNTHWFNKEDLERIIKTL